MNDGLAINLAPTGAVATKAMSRHVPISVSEIVEDARRCVALGVSILHLHARDEQGQPTFRKEVFARLIGSIRESCPDVIIGVSLSGRHVEAFEQRADALNLTGDLKPDMASLTLSSMNFGRVASMNSPDMIIRLAERMAETGIKPELEVFDAGMINYARYLAEKGLIRPPFYFNLMLGNIASAQATPGQLGLLLSELPPGSYWGGGGVGAAQLAMNTMGILYGHAVRVGLEDFLWLDTARTRPATNVDMVQRVRDLAAVYGRRIASPRDVRATLGLTVDG